MNFIVCNCDRDGRACRHMVGIRYEHEEKVLRRRGIQRIREDGGCGEQKCGGKKVVDRVVWYSSDYLGCIASRMENLSYNIGRSLCWISGGDERRLDTFIKML